MCGRFLIDDDAYSEVWMMLNRPGMAQSIIKGEIFPANIAPVITSDGALAAKWGFPHWKSAGVIINARAETALDKNMFRKPLLERRCIVPSSGFFEWDRAGGEKKKNKYLLRSSTQKVLYMAGIINIFRDSADNDYSAFVILTTGASESVKPIHDRMPVIVEPDERDLWLGDIGFMNHVLHRQGPGLSLCLIKTY